MRNVNMKKLQHYIAPVLMAFGLWFLGNALIETREARGQEVTQNFNTCQNTPYTVKAGHCVQYPTYCGGYCEKYDVYPSDCIGPPDINEKICSKAQGQIQKTYYASPCTYGSYSPNPPNFTCGCAESYGKGTINFTQGTTCEPDEKDPPT